MANKPFDQRAIHYLERPTSSDLNIAQSQINIGSRAIMRQLLQQNYLTLGLGSLGESFFVEKTSGSRNFKIKRGVGFQNFPYNPTTDLDIGGIVGLSDPFDCRLVTIQEDAGVPFEVKPAPASGFCRRDVIAIRCAGPSADNEDGRLKDSVSTDIYNVGTNVFGTSSVYKTFSYDISGAVPQVLDYNQTANATASVVYVTGQVATYNTPDDLFGAPVPIVTTDNAYLNIAIINVVGGAASVAQSDVVDYRRLTAPQGNLVVSGSATIGSLGGSPGARLQDVVLKTPPGIKAQLWKTAEGTSNSYALVVYGPRNVTAASLTCSMESSGYDDLVSNTGGFNVRPTQLVLGSKSINSGVNAAAKTLADSANASPTQQVAIGQPYHIFPFTLCRVDNVTSTVTQSVTITGDIDIEPIPNSPADAWPAGTYTVEGHTNYRTFYLQAGTSPSLPTSNLPSPTYLLSNTLNAEAEQMLEVNDIGETYQRVVGFVADLQNITWGNGIWRLPMATVGLSSVGSGFGAAPVVAVVRAYRYDGSTNPESGTPIASSQGVVLPINNANAPEFVEFLIDEIGGGTYTTSRLYIALFVKKIPLSTYSGDARFYFNYTNNNNVAFLETNILAAAPTVNIPNKADRWPAGVDLSGSFSANPVDVEFNVAGQLQRLNPAATSFAGGGFISYSDVPINFTLNLTVE